MVRNNFAKLKRIEIPEIGTASWNHIVRLHELQCREKLHAANKLSNRHIEFEQQKMKVRPLTYNGTVPYSFFILKLIILKINYRKLKYSLLQVYYQAILSGKCVSDT